MLDTFPKGWRASFSETWCLWYWSATMPLVCTNSCSTAAARLRLTGVAVALYVATPGSSCCRPLPVHVGLHTHTVCSSLRFSGAWLPWSGYPQIFILLSLWHCTAIIIIWFVLFFYLYFFLRTRYLHEFDRANMRINNDFLIVFILINMFSFSLTCW
jgi:hypothetical protein